MNLQQRQIYFNQQDAIETLYTFHPEEFEQLSEEELNLPDEYYFLRRQINIENIADYAANLLKTDPTIPQRVEAVLRKIFTAFKLNEQQAEELLPKER